MAQQFVRYTVVRSELTESPTRLGTLQVLRVILSTMDRQRRAKKKVNTALGGQQRTVYYRGETVWKFAHTPVTGNAHLQLREFLDSVEAGETWELDPGDGTGYRDMYIESTNYTERRVVKTGGGPIGDFYTFAWVGRETP
jgi:hypothetical protein